MSWYWFVFMLSLTVVVPVITGFINYRDLDKAGQFFLLLLITILVTELAAHFYRRYFGNNMIVYNIYTVVSAVLIGHYIYNLNKEKFVLYLFYGVALLSVGETVMGEPEELSNYSIVGLSIVTIIGLFYIFIQMAKDQLSTKHLIITGGLVFYFMSNFLYFFTANYLQQTEQWNYLLAMGVTKGITNMFCYGWYAIGIWKAFI
jgi:hypothetical protein